jgi:hypothetical protein
MRLRRLLGFGLPMVLLTQCAPQCAPPPVTFGSGELQVGTAVEAGVYISTSPNCDYWQRLAAPHSEVGSLFELLGEPIVVWRGGGQQNIVEIAATDALFVSFTDCEWTQYSGDGAPTDRITDGDWDVRTQMAPGRWVTEGGVSNCFWERGSGFKHGIIDTIAAGYGQGYVAVDVAATDTRFTSYGCGNWIYAGPSESPPTAGAACDPSYPTLCFPSTAGDGWCDAIPYEYFVVVPPDPHNFDNYRNGVGCDPNEVHVPGPAPF